MLLVFSLLVENSQVQFSVCPHLSFVVQYSETIPFAVDGDWAENEDSVGYEKSSASSFLITKPLKEAMPAAAVSIFSSSRHAPLSTLSWEGLQM